MSAAGDDVKKRAPTLQELTAEAIMAVKEGPNTSINAENASSYTGMR